MARCCSRLASKGVAIKIFDGHIHMLFCEYLLGNKLDISPQEAKLIIKNDTSVHMESLCSSSNCSTRSLILGMKKCSRKYPKGLASSNLTAKSRVTFSKDEFSSNETYAQVTSCYATFVNCIGNQPL